MGCRAVPKGAARDVSGCLGSADGCHCRLTMSEGVAVSSATVLNSRIAANSAEQVEDLVPTYVRHFR